ncbi:MAG: CopG family transcriptional regulator [Anaerolineae bacterium]|nr:CopG family transcriptional regulator [Anaerolineae bacterium]
MSETEKITINMSVVDLGKVDLLVESGFYANRTDFIRAAIRHQLTRHDEPLQQTVSRKAMVLGALSYSRADLEKIQAKGEKRTVRVVGLFHLDDDIDPDLALAVLESIKIYGVFRANKAVREALAERTF